MKIDYFKAYFHGILIIRMTLFCSLRMNSTTVRIAPHKVTALDTTGAGDSYAAGLHMPAAFISSLPALYRTYISGSSVTPK